MTKEEFDTIVATAREWYSLDKEPDSIECYHAYRALAIKDGVSPTSIMPFDSFNLIYKDHSVATKT